MIKTIAVGLWACAVTLGAAYGAMNFMTPPPAAAQKEEFHGKLTTVSTDPISVPIISDGVISGYVIAQFAFTVEAELMARLSVEPGLYLVDAAFRSIYDGVGIESGKFKKQAIEALADAARKTVNKRFGKPVVKDVLVQQFKFIAKDNERGRAKRSAPPGAARKSTGH